MLELDQWVSLARDADDMMIPADILQRIRYFIAIMIVC